MKTFLATSSLFILVCMAGCGKKEEVSAPSAASQPTTTAPGGYLGQITKAEQSMEKKIDVTSINSAIQLFNVQEGRNPKDLNELVEKKYLGKLPTPPFGTKLEYDATAGKVSVVKE